MEQSRNSTATPRRGGIGSRTVLLALTVLLAAWVLLWRIQSIQMFCAPAYACPRPGARLHPALLYGGLMLIPFVAIVWVQLRRPRKYRDVILRAAFSALILLALAGIAAALFAGGFALGL